VSRAFNECEPQQLRRCKLRSIGIAIALLVGVWTVGAVNAAADKVKSWTSATLPHSMSRQQASSAM
jgi:hypothetical protein